MNAKRDENNISTILGTLNSDGVTPIRIKINPANGGMKVDDNTTGTYIPRTNDIRDENNVPALMGVSEADNKTPILVYANSSGELLIDSN